MISISTSIPSHNPSRNPAKVIGSSDEFIAVSSTPAVYGVEFPINPSINDSFTMSILGITLTFIGKASPDNTGYQWKVWNDVTTWSQMISDLKKNYYLDRYFDITHNFATGEVAFTEKVPGETKLIDESTVVGSMNITIVTATELQYQLGYKTACEIHLQSVKSDPPASNLKASYEVIPNDSEAFTFEDISDGLKTLVAPAPPLISDGAVVACPEMLNFFNLKVYEEYGTPVTVKHSITIGSTDNYPRAYYGGIPMRRHGITALQYATNYITNTAKKFLTLLPQGHYVTKWQPVVLYIFVNGGINTINRRVKLYFTDGTSSTITNSTTAITNDDGCIYRIIAGYDQSSLGDVEPTKTVWKYEIWIEDDANNIISEKKLFHLHTMGDRNKDYLYFENPLGGFDAVALIGLPVLSAEVENKNERLLYPSSTPRLGHYISSPKEKYYTLTLRTGFLKKSDATWLEDILHSRNILYNNSELQVMEYLICKTTELVVWDKEANFNSYALQFNLSRTE